MMREIEEQVNKRFIGRLFEDLFGYWRIYDHIKLRIQALNDPPQLITSEEQFWFSVLGDRFAGEKQSNYIPMVNGQRVKLKDFFISEWCPKLPGQIWTSEGMRSFNEGQKRVEGAYKLNQNFYVVLDPLGKELVLSAGYGSMRINPKITDEDFCMLMALSTRKNWCCDYGIPLVVSKPVYQEFIKFSTKGSPWVESLEAVFHIGVDLPFTSMIPEAIGYRLSTETEDALRYRPFLPKCFLYVSSPIDVKMNYNDSHPDCIAWTTFTATRSPSPLLFTYTNFNPSDSNSVNLAVQFINDYVARHDGETILTDFDGQEPKLNSRVSLATDPWKHKKKDIKQITELVDKWAWNKRERSY